MKIGPTPDPKPGVIPPAKRPGPQTEAAGQASAAAVRTPATAGASVSVSSLGRALEAQRRAESGDIDQARVDQIKAAIANGTYKIDAEAIADKMLANAEEMLAPRRGLAGH